MNQIIMSIVGIALAVIGTIAVAPSLFQSTDNATAGGLAQEIAAIRAAAVMSVKDQSDYDLLPLRIEDAMPDVWAPVDRNDANFQAARAAGQAMSLASISLNNIVSQRMDAYQSYYDTEANNSNIPLDWSGWETTIPEGIALHQALTDAGTLLDNATNTYNALSSTLSSRQQTLIYHSYDTQTSQAPLRSSPGATVLAGKASFSLTQFGAKTEKGVGICVQGLNPELISLLVAKLDKTPVIKYEQWDFPGKPMESSPSGVAFEDEEGSPGLVCVAYGL